MPKKINSKELDRLVQVVDASPSGAGVDQLATHAGSTCSCALVWDKEDK